MADNLKSEARRSEEGHGLLNGDEKRVEESYDLEAAPSPATEQQAQEDKTNNNNPVEYTISPNVKYAWLCAYFFFSLILTLYNKLVLGFVRGFLDSLSVLAKLPRAGALPRRDASFTNSHKKGIH